MTKLLVQLLFAIFVSVCLGQVIYDKCRKPVTSPQQTSCGPLQTIANEGECLCCYNDTKNISTIGVGFNLRRSDAATVMAKYGLKLADVLQDCRDRTTLNCLTKAAADEIFVDYIYPEAAKCADAYVPNLPPVKRAAIIDVAFAGCATLNSLTSMQTALLKRDWKTAAAKLRSYKWCNDVKANRCNSDAKCIEGCTGGTCGNFDTTCGPQNSECYCYTVADGNSICGSDYHCANYPDCSACSPQTGVCLINTCCSNPICVPLAQFATCQKPATKSAQTDWFKPQPKRSSCFSDADCADGQKCTQHATKRRCV